MTTSSLVVMVDGAGALVTGFSVMAMDLSGVREWGLTRCGVLSGANLGANGDVKQSALERDAGRITGSGVGPQNAACRAFILRAVDWRGGNRAMEADDCKAVRTRRRLVGQVCPAQDS